MVSAAQSSLQPVKAAPGEQSVYDDGHLRVEYGNYYVSCDRQQVTLDLKGFLLISQLARHHGEFVSKEDLWRCAWGEETPCNANTLKVHIHRLRRQMSPFNVRIETRVNVGYRLLSVMELPGREDYRQRSA